MATACASPRSRACARTSRPKKSCARPKLMAASTATAVKRGAPRAAKDERQSASPAVTLTHPDRVYWEDAGVTKHDLADYLRRDLEMDAPACRRAAPIALVRCPEGADGQCFFQKHARPASPPSICIMVAGKGRQDHLHRRSRRPDRAGAGRRPGNPHPRHDDRGPRARRPAGVRPRSRAGHRLERRGRAPRARCASGSTRSSSRAS